MIQLVHKARRQIMFFLQLLITVLLLYFAFSGVNVSVVLDSIWRIPLIALMFCFLILAVQIPLIAFRWHLLLTFFDCRIAPNTLIRGILAERLVNQLLPSTVGGDSARVLTIVGGGASRGVAFLSVLFDRVSGILSIILLGGLISPLGLIYGIDSSTALTPSIIAAFAVITFIAIASMPRWILRHIVRLFRSYRLNWIADNSHDMLRHGSFYKASCLVSTLVHIMSCAVFVLIAVALLGNASLLPVAVCAPIIMFATAMPIAAGGWGVRESVSVLLLQQIGIAAADALTIAILFGIVQMLTGLLAGLALLGLQIGQPLQPEQPSPEQQEIK